MKKSSLDFLEKLKKVKNRNVLSFGEYLEKVKENPEVHLRNSPGYIKDCFDYFGTRTVKRNDRNLRRFKLFDAPFDQGRHPLIGGEDIQNKFYSFLNSQLVLNRTPRLFLIHGPNGSAKSTFIRLIMRALEAYSLTPEGFVYKFNWIFPSKAVNPHEIGFGSKPEKINLQTYAYLEHNKINALFPDEMMDHPLLLLPKNHRLNLLRELLGEDYSLPQWLRNRDLHPRNREIFDTLLLSSPKGVVEVFNYIQIEKLNFSRRYRKGLVTVEPKMAADANIRQITSDQSLQSLPPSLQNLNLYRYGGDLVNANRGLIHYEDLFKKSLEAFKYLINTLEEGYLNLDSIILQFDLTYAATVNDRQLWSFTEMPEFSSFEERTEIASLPYLLSYKLEKEIHSQVINPTQLKIKIAPHALEISSLWAIMTRLVKPKLKDEKTGNVFPELNVYEKALFYNSGKLPDRYSSTTKIEARAVVDQLYYQKISEVIYEGGIGASPRLLQSLLLKAVSKNNNKNLNIQDIFTAIEDLNQEKSTHEFLNYPAQEGGFHNLDQILEFTRKHWKNLIKKDLWKAAEIVEEKSVVNRIKKYIDLIIHHVKKEKIKDPVSGTYHEPSFKMMEEFEKELQITDDSETFRADCISRIGGYKIENPAAELNYEEIFANEINNLAEKSIFAQRSKLLKIMDKVVVCLEDPGSLEREETAIRKQVGLVRDNLKEMGYFKESILEAIDFYRRETRE
ncbi:MAG: hypothetical protein PF689_03435 [Deltaproteobacteria bacterium]|jgi:serine protein kinase|nr:hypothetical protein [Deltaproteobacteria bacterium]